MKRIIAVSALALVLSSCSSLNLVTPKTPAQTVYAVEGEYAAALNIAISYRQLPNCSTGAALCEDDATLAKVRAADAAAWSAILTAQDAVRGGLTTAQISQTASDASAAVLAFSTLVHTLRVK